MTRRIAVDPSALFALVYREPDWEAHHAVLIGNEPYLSAGSLVELGRILVVRFRQTGKEKLEGLLRTYRLRIVTHDEAQARLAISAAARFGAPAAARRRPC